jgi:hypothetical protein
MNLSSGQEMFQSLTCFESKNTARSILTYVEVAGMASAVKVWGGIQYGHT